MVSGTSSARGPLHAALKAVYPAQTGGFPDNVWKALSETSHDMADVSGCLSEERLCMGNAVLTSA